MSFRAPSKIAVDVLIVSYNSRDYLQACLTSLDQHRPGEDGPRVRVRVLDNGSRDGSANMIAASFPRVDLEVSDHNLGFVRATNRLVSASDADYVLLLNPDTVFTEDVIEPLLRVLESDTRIALVGPRLVYPDGRRQPSGERLPSLRYELACSLQGTKADVLLRPIVDLQAIIAETRAPHLYDGDAPRPVESLWATCWLMRMSDARQYGPFDERFTTYDEDVDLCRRVSNDGRVAVYVASVSLVHVGGASSDPAQKRRLMRNGRTQYYRRRSGLAAAVAYRAIVGGADASRRTLAAVRGRSRWRDRV